jgi:hypothetical protein
MPGRYATPQAFRSALTDRLNAIASDGQWTLHQLQRQVAYDRLLCRLYLADDGWIVKGATALLARGIGTRATLDVDLYRKVTQEKAEEDLRRAVQFDAGDWFRFEVGARSITESAWTLPIRAVIGATTWLDFHVDLLGDTLQMTGVPEDVAPLAQGVIPDATERGYKVYPLADHVADKVAATYDTYGVSRLPSTRYRDLVDLVSISTAASVEARALRAALLSEFKRRELTLPESFDVPERRLWEPGYAKEAQRSLLRIGQTLDEALELVRPFLDPVFANAAAGEWDPQMHAWPNG